MNSRSPDGIRQPIPATLQGRWEDYVFAIEGYGETPEDLWNAAANATPGRRSMFLLGVGFDPRAVYGLQKFLALSHPIPPVIGLIELPPFSALTGRSVRNSANNNRQTFADSINGFEVRTIQYQEVHSALNSGPRISRLLNKRSLVEGVGHLIIDVSSLPSSIYFPVIAAALKSVDAEIPDFPSQVQIAACENPGVDAAIVELEISEANFVGGFRGAFAHDSQPQTTIAWAPIVGENSGPAMRAVHGFLRPNDVFPVFPFPSRDPRRADTLLLEHQTELLYEFRVELGNIIHANEQNPFDLYKSLAQLKLDLDSAFGNLGPTALATSTHSSKLLSIGVLLAAYEHELPVVTAPPIEYELIESAIGQCVDEHRLACAWLTGEPYAWG
ncbi:MAG: hypothetical protein F4Y46_04115 [Chloroflexi bacterium]|nr:hypothetical protein [Chloroflexota bacterium]